MPGFQIAHRTPGRLRLRLPAPWIRRRGASVEEMLRGVGGVHGVTASPLTGSLRIEYDPFRLAEQSLLSQLETLLRASVRAAPARTETPSQTVAGRPLTTLAGAVGASAVLAATCLPLPTSIVAPRQVAVLRLRGAKVPPAGPARHPSTRRPCATSTPERP